MSGYPSSEVWETICARRCCAAWARPRRFTPRTAQCSRRAVPVCGGSISSCCATNRRTRPNRSSRSAHARTSASCPFRTPPTRTACGRSRIRRSCCISAAGGRISTPCRASRSSARGRRRATACRSPGRSARSWRRPALSRSAAWRSATTRRRIAARSAQAA